MKNSNGISLIALVITIIVIIILLGISIYTGINENLKKAGDSLNYTEVLEISEAVSERALFHRLNSTAYPLVGETGESGAFVVEMEIISGDQTIEQKRAYQKAEGWYKVSPDQMSELNLENVRREYLVNYETGEVVSFVPIEYSGENYYSSNSIKDAISGAGGTADASFDEAKGVNRPIVSSGMIPVKREGTEWVVTTEDDPGWYDYASQSDGKGNMWANVVMLDDLEVSGYTNAQLRVADISELVGKIVISEGSMLVWIPRFSTGQISGQDRVVYSRLTSDYFKDSAVLDAFRDNGIELTGIWVSKYDARFFE